MYSKSKLPQVSTFLAQNFNHIVAFFEYTEVFVWGEDRNGQLGIDSQTKLTAQNGQRAGYIEIPRSCSFNIVIKQVSCGERHSGIVTN
jgi:alpha-tubulin suppressor-like RCC1 family protein